MLSNILLDLLDKELEKRGHKFVRYADDCSIYIHSLRAGERVLASITRFIEEELKLKVNQTKSGVRPAHRMKLLGYAAACGKGIWAQWKRVRTRFKALVKLGASRRNAYIWANTPKGGWHTAHSYVLTGTITNARLRQPRNGWVLSVYAGGLIFMREPIGRA